MNANERIISPVTGTFANRQVLVIDDSDGAECFYSFSGTDPMTSGFAYDGPVLIDNAGDVKVNIVCQKGESKEEYEVDFTVNEKPLRASSSETQDETGYFYSTVVKQGICQYSSETPLSIPAALSYCLGDGNKPFISGTLLSLDPSNRLSRYLPCTVRNGEDLYRFIIHVTAEQSGILSKQDVPFRIENWTTFTFTGEKLIYAIDDGEWSASKLPVVLDRSVSHTVKWQAVAYEPGNPVLSFVLPPAPQIKCDYIKKEGGAVRFSLKGDSRYKMRVLNSGVPGACADENGLFERIVFDTFAGDQVSAIADFEIYCDGVLQGVLPGQYRIDRQPPLAPVFNAGDSKFYARSAVTLNISSPETSQIYYTVSEPLLVSYEDMQKDDISFEASKNKVFRKYENPLRLLAGRQGAVYYMVRAYAVDDYNNISDISEYSVVIDEYNYYIDSTAQVDYSDGSRSRPFTTFGQAVSVINKARFAHFYVKGQLVLSEGETVISSNCSFAAAGDTSASIIIPSNSSVVIRSASFEAENILFEKEKNDADARNSLMFVLENSTANFDSCEIVSVFSENGTGFSIRNSVLNFSGTRLTVQSDSYVCAVSSNESKVNAKNSFFTAIAPTCVDFSVTGGNLDLRNSECRVIGHLGRIAELTRVNARIVSNKFNGEFDKKQKNLTAVWCDDKTVLLEDRENL
ncbi:MAG: hypothetical protein J6Y93_04115, partial [Treponema sp.]|nr:hypothetical protein [Treponema sp.]